MDQKSSTLEDAERPTRSTDRSKRAYEAAREVLPSGSARPNICFSPYPIVADHGEGAYVVDVDGNRYLDLNNNLAALVHGHAHPDVVAALWEQAGRGLSFGVPNLREAELARIIVSRVPSVDQVTFCNSGTEASLLAISLARSFSGRQLIAKFEGGYHGHADEILVSVRQADDNGQATRPRTVAHGRGTTDGHLGLVVTLPFNDADSVEQILTERAGEIAGVVVEPIQVVGGTITPEAGFLERLQTITARLGILLIVDEVVTLRLSVGGGQEVFRLSPDLTIMGKIIGGGLPVGGVGGRREVMELMDPLAKRQPTRSTGTFSGNPMTMAAGIATLNALSAPAIERINALGERLRYGLNQFCYENGLAATVGGWGSLLNLHFQADPVRTTRDTWKDDRERAFAFFRAMLADGFLLTPRGSLSLSTAMTEDDVERFYEASTHNLERVCTT